MYTHACIDCPRVCPTLTHTEEWIQNNEGCHFLSNSRRQLSVVTVLTACMMLLCFKCQRIQSTKNEYIFYKRGENDYKAKQILVMRKRRRNNLITPPVFRYYTVNYMHLLMRWRKKGRWRNRIPIIFNIPKRLVARQPRWEWEWV